MSDEIENKSEGKNTGITAGDAAGISAFVFFVGFVIVLFLYLAINLIHTHGFNEGRRQNYEKCRAANIERPFECPL